MLEMVSIVCPSCGERTDLSVARTSAGERAFAHTACRRCRTPFLAVTQQDGRVVLLDAASVSDPATAASPRVVGVIGPAGGRSGYHVVPPADLGIFERGHPPPPPPPGISDEALRTVVSDLDRVLRRPDGSPRAPGDAAKHVGWRGVWVAQLDEALRRRLAGPPPLTFPPAIFLSYRWGTAEENQWTARLAHVLKQRGYPVVFDRDEPRDLDVPELVSRIADCRFFLAVLDDGYAERLGHPDDDRIKDGWVFDEHNVAVHLSNARQLRIVGLLRGGSRLPSGFRLPAPGTPGNVVDVREPGVLDRVLDDAFPELRPAPDAETVQRARALLARSHAALCADRFAEALAAAAELTALLPGVIDGPAQEVRVALRAGRADVGLAAAERALALAPRSRELLRAAGTFASGGGEPRRAARYLGAYLEAQGDAEPAEAAQAHFALGSALDDLGQVHPALAHLEVARRAAPEDANLLNTLGYVYRRAAAPARALEHLAAGLAQEPGNVNLLLNEAAALLEAGRYAEAAGAIQRLEAAAPGLDEVDGLRALLASATGGDPHAPPSPGRVVHAASDRWVSCDACEAQVPLGATETLCARCGSVVSRRPGPCPSCTSDGKVVLVPGLPQQCPFCREGRLSEGTVEHPGPSGVGQGR